MVEFIFERHPQSTPPTDAEMRIDLEVGMPYAYGEILLLFAYSGRVPNVEAYWSTMTCFKAKPKEHAEKNDGRTQQERGI